MVTIAGELPDRIADMTSVALDLMAAHDAAATIRDHEPAPGESPPPVFAAVWAGALIYYRRCFGGNAGQRPGSQRWRPPASWLDDLGRPDLRGAHDELMYFADKHAAHRVDLMADQVRVNVVLAPDGPRRAIGTAPLVARLLVPNEQLEAMIELTELLHPAIEGELEDLQSQLVDLVNDRGVDSLYEALDDR